jgi:hypothetical protein
MNDSLVALVATLHDPESRLAPLAEPFISGWVARFREVVILTSPEGSGATGGLLTRHGARVVEDTQPQGVSQLGRVRLRALQAAAQGHHPYYFLVDFDRLIHWERHYPDELRRVEQAIPGYDFLTLGRTRRAFETHPAVQRYTERCANEGFAASFGDPLDVTAGARGLSLKAVRLLAQHSRCEGFGVDAEWPVLCRRWRLRLGYFAAEGLEFETADRFAPEIERLGYETWLDLHINTPRAWEERLRFAHEITRAAREATERDLVLS